MNIDKFNSDDYKIVSEWWRSQDWPTVPSNLLSNHGFIIRDESIPIVAGWVYETGTPMFLLEWIVGNPDIDWEKRQEGILTLVDFCSEYSKQLGAQMLFTMIKNERLMDKIESKGFMKTDENMSHFIRSL
jgi:hypothetical protein